MSVTTSKLLAIFDTNIILQSTLVPHGVAEAALQWVETGFVGAVMSDRLRAEYEEILERLALLDKFKQLRKEGVIENQLARVDALIERVPNAPEQIHYLRDPNDAPTINLAAYVRADFIVSWDADLLDLNRDPVFHRLCPTTMVLNPADFVREMERRRAAGLNQPPVP